MKVQSFFSSASALTSIANQVVAWGSRIVTALSTNPATTLIGCIALAALGTAAHIFNRCKASEEKSAALEEKMNALNGRVTTLSSVSGERNEPSANTLTTGEKVEVQLANKQIANLKDQVIKLEKNIGELEGKLGTEAKEIETYKEIQDKMYKLFEENVTNVKHLKETSEKNENAILQTQKQLSEKVARANEELKNILSGDISIKASKKELSDAVGGLQESKKQLEGRIRDLTGQLQEAQEKLGKVTHKQDAMEEANLSTLINQNTVAISQVKAEVANLNNFKKTVENSKLDETPLKKRANSTPEKTTVPPNGLSRLASNIPSTPFHKALNFNAFRSIAMPLGDSTNKTRGLSSDGNRNIVKGT